MNARSNDVGELCEPLVHSHIEDGLPPDHPLAEKQVPCAGELGGCGKLLHAWNNECMRTWVETGLGNYCLWCFAKLSREMVDTPWALTRVKVG
jgi:hypothetical protein